MPLIVDKQQVRSEILNALQQCLQEKPLIKVSMRDIASKAKIAHSKINYYFDSKEQLLLAYIEFFAISYQIEIDQWYVKYRENINDIIESPDKIVKRFIKDMVLINHKNQSWAFTQISATAQYNIEIKTNIQDVYSSWRNSIEHLLEEIYQDKGDHLADKAETILIIIDGMIVYFLCEHADELKIDSILENIVL